MSADTARAFFAAWSAHDVDEAMRHVADDCEYRDFAFVRPHIGKASVRAMVEHAITTMAPLGLVIQETAGTNPLGARWELTWNGELTGRTGVSFYRFDDQDRLLWVQDAGDPGPKHRTVDLH